MYFIISQWRTIGIRLELIIQIHSLSRFKFIFLPGNQFKISPILCYFSEGSEYFLNWILNIDHNSDATILHHRENLYSCPWGLFCDEKKRGDSSPDCIGTCQMALHKYLRSSILMNWTVLAEDTQTAITNRRTRMKRTQKCKDRTCAYIKECKNLLNLVQVRVYYTSW